MNNCLKINVNSWVKIPGCGQFNHNFSPVISKKAQLHAMFADEEIVATAE
jgi:hypothetical protein